MLFPRAPPPFKAHTGVAKFLPTACNCSFTRSARPALVMHAKLERRLTFFSENRTSSSRAVSSSRRVNFCLHALCASRPPDTLERPLSSSTLAKCCRFSSSPTRRRSLATFSSSCSHRNCSFLSASRARPRNASRPMQVRLWPNYCGAEPTLPPGFPLSPARIAAVLLHAQLRLQSVTLNARHVQSLRASSPASTRHELGLQTSAGRSTELTRASPDARRLQRRQRLCAPSSIFLHSTTFCEAHRCQSFSLARHLRRAQRLLPLHL